MADLKAIFGGMKQTKPSHQIKREVVEEGNLGYIRAQVQKKEEEKKKKEDEKKRAAELKSAEAVQESEEHSDENSSEQEDVVDESI